MSHTNRVVLLIDMDCFYCQVEEKLNPSLKGKPVAVVQYNAWKGGGIIAVNYQARDRGVTRHMRGDEAKRKCPDIQLVRVPNVRGKADLTKYRDAGKSVAKVLQTFTPLFERASVDEAYLDITEAVQKRLENTTADIKLNQLKNTHVVNCDTMDFLYNLYNSGLYEESSMKLAIGGVITEEIRTAVFQQTGYTCSAGIAHNKILAKLACGLHKPNKQTILPQDSVRELYKDLPVKKIRSLGGKFGSTLSDDLGITYMGELVKFTVKELAKRYDEKTASFLYNIARGIDTSPVTVRLVSKSIGCCKKFPGKSALVDVDSVMHWLNELALEMIERLDSDSEENNRRAKQMVISFSQGVHGKDVASSRTFNLTHYDQKKLVAQAYEILKKNCLNASGTFCLKFLGLNASKFENCRNVNEITSFFKIGGDSAKSNTSENCNDESNANRDSFIPNFVKNSTSDLQEDDLEQTDDANTTSFSATTEELDENSSEFVFFNENSNTNTISDSDSITNELCDAGSNDLHKEQPQKESFFLRYFENLKKDRKSPVLRDFNTSRNLEELDECKPSEDDRSDTDVFADESEASTSDPPPGTVTSHSDIVYGNPGTSRDVFEYENGSEVCGDCGKKIVKSEMVAHMDYHFAIKIVREESDLYKNDRQSVQTKKETKKDVKKSGKRKLAEVEKNSTLEMFLKVQQMEYSNNSTELCPQCDRRIDVESFGSHLDYHTAKKLHLEINPIKPRGAENLNKSKENRARKTKNLKNNIGGVRSVITFFKTDN